jgi:phosphate starvation-inducible protein PhoH
MGRRRYEHDESSESSSKDTHRTVVSTKGMYVKELKPKNQAQDLYMSMIRESTVHFGLGPAGTGKTFIAVYLALDALLKNEVEKVILTRPIVAVEDIGYLPGDMSEKIHPYVMPLFDAIEDHLGPTKAKDLLNSGRIEVLPLAYMRGRSLNKCVTADSLVTLADGSQIRIDDLLVKYEAGEKIVVKSFNHDTGKVEDSPISYAFKQPCEEKLLKLTLEDGTVLKVTKDHKLFVRNFQPIDIGSLKDGDVLDGGTVGYLEAQDISNGDILLNLEHYKEFGFYGVSPNGVKLIEEIDPEDVYDITVPGNHNFFLNNILSHNCFIILDEAQNTTVEQMKMFLTRLGYDSKMVVTGDSSQSDLKVDVNGLEWASRKLAGKTGEITVSEFTSKNIVRNPLIGVMLKHLDGPDPKEVTKTKVSSTY